MLKLSGVVNFCRDFSKIENFEIADSDTKNKWVCHHRLETHTSNGELRPKEASLTKEELIALDMYYNRPPEELIFLTVSEHCALHNHFRAGMKGKKMRDLMSTEAWEAKCKKTSETLKGHTLSEETKEKIRLHSKAKDPEVRKKMSDSHKGKKMPKETLEKMSKSRKGKKVFNNGVITIRCFESECPPGFVPGFVSKKKEEKNV